LEGCSTNANVLRAADHASRAQAGNSRTRTRTLRPLLIPPSFPPDLLLPTTSTPASDQPPSSSLSSSSSLYQGEEKQTTETHTDANSSATTIQLTDLPPNTLKADIRPVFQHYGEVKRVIVQPDGRSAVVVFADAVAVSRVLHAYADEPLRVRGQEIVVFRERSAHRGPGVKVGSLRGTPRARHEKMDDGEGDGAIFVSNFPAGTTQEEVLEAVAPLGKYEGIVMRTCFTSSFFFSLSLGRAIRFSQPALTGPGSKYAYVMYLSNDRVDDVLRAHDRLPITIRRKALRVERTENRPFILSNEPSDSTLEIGKSLDPAESSAVAEELKETVQKWRGSCEPSRVLWIGRLPYNIDHDALTNFWSRIGCVVEVRSSTFNMIASTRLPTPFFCL